MAVSPAAGGSTVSVKVGEKLTWVKVAPASVDRQMPPSSELKLQQQQHQQQQRASSGQQENSDGD